MLISLDELLQPISDANPAGDDLRYAPIADQIREARRQEDDLNQGVWKRSFKTADYVLVIKLCEQALTKQGKDLQIAAWYTEARLIREGYVGLLQGLTLLRALLNQFWDTVHPQMDEDGDLNLRATPLQWVATQLDRPVKTVPLNNAGHDWLRYTDSRSVPTEEDANTRPERGQARREAVDEGRLTPEDFERSFASTPRAFYEKLILVLDEVLQFLRDFSSECDTRFADAGPDFGPLSASLTEVRGSVHVLLVKKRVAEPDAVSTAVPPPSEPLDFVAVEASPFDGVQETFTVADVPAPPTISTPAAAAAPFKRMRGFQTAAEATEGLLEAVHFLRSQDPANPAPYLVLRALRWGELRASSVFDASSAGAPPVDVRISLKRLSNEGEWTGVIESAEKAMAEPYGGQWLDLQRYAVNALKANFCEAAATAILSELKTLLADYPDLPERSLADDTPAANKETRDWLETEKLLPAEPLPVSTPPEPVVPFSLAVSVAPEATTSEPVPDVFEEALQLAQSGSLREALRRMTETLSQEQSGRGRFLRRLQIAKILMVTSHHNLALPFLEELADAISHHELQQWEAREVLSEPLGMLYQCRARLQVAETESLELFARICRIDPIQALTLVHPHGS